MTLGKGQPHNWDIREMHTLYNSRKSSRQWQPTFFHGPHNFTGYISTDSLVYSSQTCWLGVLLLHAWFERRCLDSITELLSIKRGLYRCSLSFARQDPWLKRDGFNDGRGLPECSDIALGAVLVPFLDLSPTNKFMDQCVSV